MKPQDYENHCKVNDARVAAQDAERANIAYMLKTNPEKLAEAIDEYVADKGVEVGALLLAFSEHGKFAVDNFTACTKIVDAAIEYRVRAEMRDAE